MTTIVERVNLLLELMPDASRESLAQRCIGLQDEVDALKRADPQREQTAATLLAALIRDADVAESFGIGSKSTLQPVDRDRVAYAVALTDALRAALKGGSQ